MDTAIDAAANLPRDLAVVKMENDQIFALAAARRRDMSAIGSSLPRCQTFPQFADDAIYEAVRQDESGKMKYARGLSVRAAEAAGRVLRVQPHPTRTWNRCPMGE